MFLAAGGWICCPCLATETLGMDFRHFGMPATEFDHLVSCLQPSICIPVGIKSYILLHIHRWFHTEVWITLKFSSSWTLQGSLDDLKCLKPWEGLYSIPMLLALFGIVWRIDFFKCTIYASTWLCGMWKLVKNRKVTRVTVSVPNESNGRRGTKFCLWENNKTWPTARKCRTCQYITDDYIILYDYMAEITEVASCWRAFIILVKLSEWYDSSISIAVT